MDDLIDGLVRPMATEDRVTGRLNIGNPTEFTILELARQIIEMAGSRIVHRPLLDEDPQQRPGYFVCPRTASLELRTPLKEGLVHTVAYFERLLTRRESKRP